MLDRLCRIVPKCRRDGHISFCSQVDENGKINRLRRECPGEKCGAGVFMAAHKDRQYCGKCGKTFVFNAPENDD